MFIKNKKALTEIVSFVLLILIVVVASGSAYIFSTNLIGQKISKLDKTNMEINIKKINNKINLISSFDDSTTSFDINFNKGNLVFNSNQIYYQSLEKFSGTSICINNLCYRQVSGFERIYLNLTSPLQFKTNISLNPGFYKLTFTNIKNESKIKINFN